MLTLLMYYLPNLSSDFVDEYHFVHEKFNMSSTITCVKYVNNRSLQRCKLTGLLYITAIVLI